MTGPSSTAGTEAETPDAGSTPERVWSVDEHLADVLAGVEPLEPLDLQLLDAHGCVLLEDVATTGELPPFDNSSMDGYAVRIADLHGASAEHPAVLSLAGEVAAGGSVLPEVVPGSCVRIMTGAPVPPGAEAVVPVEWTDGGSGSGSAAESMEAGGAPPEPGSEVRVFRPAAEGAHIRRAGSDVRSGETVLEAGTILGPSQIGLLAAIGRERVRVRPRARVVVLSTGSELVQPGVEPGAGQIHDSNSFMLTAAVREAGAIAYRVGAVPDDAAELLNAVEDQLIRADLVITSGGVSVGAYDVVKEVFEELGEVSFRKLAMQPGKPQGYGPIGPDGTPLFALPGNPVSAYVSFELFVRPAVRKLMGLEPQHRTVVRAVCSERLNSPVGRRQFLRGRYTAPAEPGGIGGVEPVGGAGSHLVAALAQADCLIVVPEAEGELAAGTELDVMLLQ